MDLLEGKKQQIEVVLSTRELLQDMYIKVIWNSLYREWEKSIWFRDFTELFPQRHIP